MGKTALCAHEVTLKRLSHNLTNGTFSLLPVLNARARYRRKKAKLFEYGRKYREAKKDLAASYV